ncbi:MAG: MFS transporter [bacterium]
MSRAREFGAEGAGASAARGRGFLKGVPWTATALLFMAHFVVDSHVSFLSPLLPLLREKFQLSLGAVGMLVYLLSMSNALAQPLTAVVVDRWPRLPWLVVGVVGSSVCLTAVGWLPSYAAVAVVLPAGGALAGLCHPDMGSRAGALSESRRGIIVSIFVTGGRLGFALGPLMAIAVAEWWGMEWLWVYVIVSVALVAAMRWGLPVPKARAGGGGSLGLGGLGAALRKAGAPLLILMGVTFSRAAVNVNFQGFLPTLYVDQGLSLWEGGAANAILLLFGGAGVMLGGVLSGRFQTRSLIAAGIGAAFLATCAFFVAPPWLGYFVLAVMGTGLYLPMGVGVALAQDLLPGHRGFASSLMLGATWFLASLTVLPITELAERVGLLRAFWVLPLFLLAGFFLALRLPKDRP